MGRAEIFCAESGSRVYPDASKFCSPGTGEQLFFAQRGRCGLRLVESMYRCVFGTYDTKTLERELEHS